MSPRRVSNAVLRSSPHPKMLAVEAPVPMGISHSDSHVGICEYYQGESPESSCRDTPAQEKFAAMSTHETAKRVLVFGNQKWDSASESSSNQEEEEGCIDEICSPRGHDDTQLLLDRARDRAMFEMQEAEDKAFNLTDGNVISGAERESDSDDVFNLGDVSRDLSAITRVLSSNNTAQTRARRYTDGSKATGEKMEPELHDVTETLWDFAKHVDRIENRIEMHEITLQLDTQVM